MLLSVKETCRGAVPEREDAEKDASGTVTEGVTIRLSFATVSGTPFAPKFSPEISSVSPFFESTTKLTTSIFVRQE